MYYKKILKNGYFYTNSKKRILISNQPFWNKRNQIQNNTQLFQSEKFEAQLAILNPFWSKEAVCFSPLDWSDVSTCVYNFVFPIMEVQLIISRKVWTEQVQFKKCQIQSSFIMLGTLNNSGNPAHKLLIFLDYC